MCGDTLQQQQQQQQPPPPGLSSCHNTKAMGQPYLYCTFDSLSLYYVHILLHYGQSSFIVLSAHRNTVLKYVCAYDCI